MVTHWYENRGLIATGSQVNLLPASASGAVAMTVPGTTEFGYEPTTVVQMDGPGSSSPENRHITYAASDVIASLDDLQAMCPNLERVAVVVAWFGNDLRAGHCTIQPGVDRRSAARRPTTASPT